MEEELLRKNLSLIKSVADRAGVEIILAFKSFAMWRSFPIFREYIGHSTASSVYEARLALEEFGSKAHTYSPAYTEADFPEIMRCSSHITFNSMAQFHRFYPMTVAGGSDISCGIRINPEYSEVETELYNPCAPGTRFGITADLLPERLPQGIEGFHCHCHCESSSFELERTLQHLEEKFSPWFSQIKWLNLGGGHLIDLMDLVGVDLAVRAPNRHGIRAYADHHMVAQLPGARGSERRLGRHEHGPPDRRCHRRPRAGDPDGNVYRPALGCDRWREEHVRGRERVWHPVGAARERHHLLRHGGHGLLRRPRQRRRLHPRHRPARTQSRPPSRRLA